MRRSKEWERQPFCLIANLSFENTTPEYLGWKPRFFSSIWLAIGAGNQDTDQIFWSEKKQFLSLKIIRNHERKRYF